MSGTEDKQKKVVDVTNKARVAWATQVFERIKDGAKVSARDLEKSNAIFMDMASEKSKTIPAEWAFNQVELAENLGVDRKTIQRWLKIDGCPEAKSDGRYNILEFKEWALKTGRKYESDEDFDSDERNKLEVRRLRTICERLDLELEVQKGNYSANEDVEIMVRRMVSSARKVLSQIPSQLAPQLSGLATADIEIRLKQAVEEALINLHSGKWTDESS
jgi:hypothetical protein